eukprot:scaffold9778_cov72-Phaeocystis_antarctica.AAC.4
MPAIIGDAAYATTLLLSLLLLCRELTTCRTLGKTLNQTLHHAVAEIVCCSIQWYCDTVLARVSLQCRNARRQSAPPRHFRGSWMDPIYAYHIYLLAASRAQVPHGPAYVGRRCCTVARDVLVLLLRLPSAAAGRNAIQWKRPTELCRTEPCRRRRQPDADCAVRGQAPLRDDR